MAATSKEDFIFNIIKVTWSVNWVPSILLPTAKIPSAGLEVDRFLDIRSEDMYLFLDPTVMGYRYRYRLEHGQLDYEVAKQLKALVEIEAKNFILSNFHI